MLLVRHGMRLAKQLGLFGARSGLWWVPVMVPLLAIAAVAIATAKAAVPVALYVFF